MPLLIFDGPEMVVTKLATSTRPEVSEQVEGLVDNELDCDW